MESFDVKCPAIRVRARGVRWAVPGEMSRAERGFFLAVRPSDAGACLPSGRNMVGGTISGVRQTVPKL